MATTAPKKRPGNKRPPRKPGAARRTPAKRSPTSSDAARRRAADSFEALAELRTPQGRFAYYRLDRLGPQVATLPCSLKILLEALLRTADGAVVRADDVRRLAAWDPRPARDAGEVPFKPARVLLQDFTGVPCVVDLAAMRDAMARLGGDPGRINPQVPVDLVIDHSVQVDEHASPQALARNAALEFERNQERYRFLHWGQRAFANFSVVPPASGICHQVNLEHLAQVVRRAPLSAGPRARARRGAPATLLLPDSLVGTDSHTPMVNGLGVLGWGVGGIEAEAVMLGQPLSLVTPAVVGVELSGALRPGVTATDLVLTLTERLRRHGVVDKFVEFWGPGLDSMSVPDRATIANMAPEYGATVGFFPVDDQTLRYLRQTGRDDEQVTLVEAYCKAQGLWREPGASPRFSERLALDLTSVEPSLAGPKRPQDRVPLAELGARLRRDLHAPPERQGYGLPAAAATASAPLRFPDGGSGTLRHGDVVLAAITSCTNTSNPAVMLGAGLLARKAGAAGLRVPPHVKTSLAPGSRVVSDYLRQTGLLADLEALGFHVVGYGCTTCIGNSGPLPAHVAAAIEAGDLVAAAVLSGNRNFEGRINPLTRANYLASPPLVVAFALAGTTAIDLTREPLGRGRDGRPVYLAELWPSAAEIEALLPAASDGRLYRRAYAAIARGHEAWNALGGAATPDRYPWDEASTYIQPPPFFTDMGHAPVPPRDIQQARVLVMVGDSVTTDHISPAGDIPADSPAGRYLRERGVTPADFNSYGSRRGNDRVMTRGTFANIRLKNLLAPGTEGGWTTHLPSGARLSIFEASQRYQAAGTPLLVLAGKDYGMGSSRDWAAKGTALLGVRAVLAQSFERIHRANLVGMGVLPLQFAPDESAASLGLRGDERYTIALPPDLRPGQELAVLVDPSPPDEPQPPPGQRRTLRVQCRLQSALEVDYYRHGGVLPRVLRQLLER